MSITLGGYDSDRKTSATAVGADEGQVKERAAGVCRGWRMYVPVTVRATYWVGRASRVRSHVKESHTQPPGQRGASAVLYTYISHLPSHVVSAKCRSIARICNLLMKSHASR